MHFVYGSIVHKIAEEYVRNKGQISITDIANELLKKKSNFKKNITEDGPMVLPMEYKNKLSDHLRAISSLTKELGFEGHLEYEFEFDLDPPNNKILKGAIDRLIPNRDLWYILDYKTTKKGNWWKDTDTIKHDLQLQAYSMVIQERFNTEATKIVAGLYYLEGPKIIGTKFTQDKLNNTKKILLDCYNEIEAALPEEAYHRIGFNCNNCAYNNVCEPFKNSVLVREYNQWGNSSD